MESNRAEGERSNESPEAKAEEELLALGVEALPENVQTVLELQKVKQHPEGYEDIVASDSLEDIANAMRDKGINHVIHHEDPSLWIHCKLAMRLADFLPISDEKKADLKLIMLYHDLGKVGLPDTHEIKKIQKKELAKGKLYKVAKGHASEKWDKIEAGFRANGISGKKLKMFMAVVRNHMETQLSGMPGHKLAGLFRHFGATDEARKQGAEMLAWAVQLDGNACAHLQFTEEGELASLKKENTTGLDFDKIWARYEEAKGG